MEVVPMLWQTTDIASKGSVFRLYFPVSSLVVPPMLGCLAAVFGRQAKASPLEVTVTFQGFRFWEKRKGIMDGK